MAAIDVDKRVTESRTGNSEGEAISAGKRRSLRVVIDIAVSVFGHDLEHKIFQEKTSTLTVSAHGASVVLNTNIDPQKPALLINCKTGATVQCRVAHRKELDKGRVEIGFEFENPLPKFWAINFPPEDWNPADRKRPNLPTRPAATLSKGAKK
jgi:hypothetical protein